MKEENSIFLKVDSVEPVYKNDFYFSASKYERIDGVKVWINGNGHFFPCDSYTVCDPDVVREDGRRQAFALMKKIYDMSGNERKDAFGKVFFSEILRSANYDDLAKKLDAWKKEKEEICIKDEVQHKEFGAKAVVIGIQKDEYGRDHIYAITKKKEFITDALASDYAKTGVHVDDIDTYLGV